MAKSKTLKLHFPLAGVDQGRAFQTQPPYTTADARNVRPDATIQGRERGGSRPGLIKAFGEVLGSGNPIRSLVQVTYITGDGFRVWSDTFDRTALGDIWGTASWIGTAPSLTDETFASITYSSTVGAVRDAVSDLDATEAYEIGVMVVPYQAAHHGRYSLFARMDNTTPVATTAGVEARLEMTGTDGSFDGWVKVYVAGVATTYAFTSGTDTYPKAGWFTLVVSTNDVSCYWQGNTLLAAQTISAAAGSRIGFGMQATVEDGVCLTDAFRLQYYRDTNDQVWRRPLIASANGSLYKETRQGVMGSALSVTPTLASTHSVQAWEHLQKVYYADHDTERCSGTDGVFGAATTLTAATVANWATAGVVAGDDVLVVTNATGTVLNGTYKIASAPAGTLTTTASVGGTGNCSFRVERAGKVYDPSDDSLAIWTATTGTVPTGCRWGCRWRDRAVLGGSAAAPHMWSMSKAGDPLDWNTAADALDATRAIDGTTGEAGKVGEATIAGIPHGDDYLVVACVSTLYVFRGDPCYGGQLDNLSQDDGIVHKDAWCRGPANEVILLGHGGLFVIPEGAKGQPINASMEKLPRKLINIDSQVYDVSMEYDRRERGVHIFLTSIESNATDHWWFDWTNKSFWPFTHAAAHEPMSIIRYSAQVPEEGGVLLGCRDGYLRRYHRSAATDDGTAISSYVQYGPMRMGTDVNHRGILKELDGVLAAGSGNVTWGVHVAETAEGATTADAAITGTWVAGKNYVSRPEASGEGLVVKLTGAATDRAWAIETARAVLTDVGPAYKL